MRTDDENDRGCPRPATLDAARKLVATQGLVGFLADVRAVPGIHPAWLDQDKLTSFTFTYPVVQLEQQTMTINKRALETILTLHDAWLSDSGGERANLREADLAGCNLDWVNLRRADLRGADLNEASLNGACLAEADLDGACLADAIMASANLQDASLTEADLSGAYLSGAILSDAYLDGAVFSRSTVLPTGEPWWRYLEEVVPALLAAGGKALKHVAIAWTCHTWEDCPMKRAFGVEEEDIPPIWWPRVQQFLLFYDAGLIPRPREKPSGERRGPGCVGA